MKLAKLALSKFKKTQLIGFKLPTYRTLTCFLGTIKGAGSLQQVVLDKQTHPLTSLLLAFKLS